MQPYNPHENSGTGWTFSWCSGEAFREAIWNAIYTFRYRLRLGSIARVKTAAFSVNPLVLPSGSWVKLTQKCTVPSVGAREKGVEAQAFLKLSRLQTY